VISAIKIGSEDTQKKTLLIFKNRHPKRYMMDHKTTCSSFSIFKNNFLLQNQFVICHFPCATESIKVMILEVIQDLY
jgi:hypothetical protein